MKKLFTLLAVAFLVAACEGPMGPMGPQGPQGQNGADGAMNVLVVDSDVLYVEPNDWVRSPATGDFDHFYYDFFINGFTSAAFNNGIYATYWKYGEDDGSGNLIQIQEGLGATMFLSWVDDVTGETIFFSETVACDYSVGNLRIKYYVSDFDEISRPSATLYFRFVAVW